MSPQVTNLALNTGEELRTDWVNLLLGGENWRWSNFQLAEAVSRLITERGVPGKLVAGAGGWHRRASRTGVCRRRTCWTTMPASE